MQTYMFSMLPYGKIEHLVSILLHYDFAVYASNHLLHEVHEALTKPGILKSEKIRPFDVILFLQKVIFLIAEEPKFQLAPDLDDNYLFDLALQSGCLFIFTSDKAIINMKKQPVAVFSTDWFKSIPRLV